MTFGIEYQPEFESFFKRHASSASTKEARSEILAKKFSTLADVYHHGEPYGEIHIESNGAATKARAFGATILAVELIWVRDKLAEGDDLVVTRDNGGNYGVLMRIERAGNKVWIGPSDGPTSASVETSWDLFAKGVDRYLEWFHTDYMAEASWLLRVGYVQEMRRKAGHPPDHL